MPENKDDVTTIDENLFTGTGHHDPYNTVREIFTHEETYRDPISFRIFEIIFYILYIGFMLGTCGFAIYGLYRFAMG